MFEKIRILQLGSEDWRLKYQLPDNVDFSFEEKLNDEQLNKELKNLPYGFGACIGYSMIKDDIKTLSDRVDKHNNLIERMAVVEQKLKNLEDK